MEKSINYSESYIQNQIRCALSKYGVVIRMNTGNVQTQSGTYIRCGVKGMSDLLFVGQGYIAWIEVKTPTGKPSPEQIKFINRMRQLGHRAGIARSVEEALDIVNNRT